MFIYLKTLCNYWEVYSLSIFLFEIKNLIVVNDRWSKHYQIWKVFQIMSGQPKIMSLSQQNETHTQLICMIKTKPVFLCLIQDLNSKFNHKVNYKGKEKLIKIFKFWTEPLNKAVTKMLYLKNTEKEPLHWHICIFYKLNLLNWTLRHWEKNC